MKYAPCSLYADSVVQRMQEGGARYFVRRLFQFLAIRDVVSYS